MTAHIIRGDARALPLPDASVDLIVTSPPYWSLRSYTDGGEHYADQIGAEPTPQEYVASLIDCTREWMRVLKPTGSIFVNLGDKYSSGSGGQSNLTALGQRLGTGGGQKQDSAKQRSGPVAGAPPKSLLLLPERYRIACADELGLVVRAVIVWSKPNGLPESVQDRVRRSHEDWVHLTKSPRYYSAADEIREPSETGSRVMFQSSRGNARGMPPRGPSDLDPVVRANHPLGKLPGSVWTIATQPLKVPEHLGVDHFAAFPMELPRRIIQGWSPPGICTECGQGRRPIVDRQAVPVPGATASGGIVAQRVDWRNPDGRTGVPKRSEVTITGWVCGCPEPTAPSRPAVVLDPFGGTGTSALVASVLGRTGISVDRSADYCRLAAWRTTDARERARAAEQPPPKTTTAVDGQLDLLGDVS